MAHTLQLQVPDDVYRSLVESARETGQALEALAAEFLARAAKGREDDPLDEFVGAFASDAPDWADDHDRLIGQAAASKMDTVKRPGD